MWSVKGGRYGGGLFGHRLSSRTHHDRIRSGVGSDGLWWSSFECSTLHILPQPEAPIPIPAFVNAFGTRYQNASILAVANEAGTVSFVDTTSDDAAQLDLGYHSSVMFHTGCHTNAI